MLDKEKQIEIRSEIFHGCILPIVNRARLQPDQTEYRDICAFIIATLREFHGVPHGKHARFFIAFDQRFGQTTECGMWHENGRDEFQFVGELTLHPDPLFESAPLAAKKFLGVRYRPKHETRRAPSGEVAFPDFKSLAAGKD